MKYSIIFSLFLFCLPFHLLSAKSEKEVIIDSASQFQRWCKQLSYRHFRQKHQMPYNWSASTIRQLNDYQTFGRWKVNNKQKKVFCQIRIGNKARKTKMKIE